MLSRWAGFVVVLALLASAGSDAAIIRVKTTGNDSNNGSSWSLAKKTLDSAVAAATTGDQIWVAKGTYQQPWGLSLALQEGVSLYGGFQGNEVQLIDRASFPRPVPDANETVLDGGGQYPDAIVSVTGTGCRVDGFTLRNSHRYGIIVAADSVAVNNRISEVGCGVLCSATATVANNIIQKNYNPDYGGGVFVNGGSPTICNNVIVANSASRGGGFYISSGTPVIVNNTITGNTSGLCGGIYVVDGSPKIANNIIAFNSAGIENAGTGVPVLSANCVYNPECANYTNITAGPTDISTDPLLSGREYGSVHLLSASPCINAGDDTSANASWRDMDGEGRVYNSHVDIGADEWSGVDRTFTPLIVRVSPTGSDSNDGSSWAAAKKTVQSAVDKATSVGGEVWIAEGTYTSIVSLKQFVHLYGGFGGTETTRAERNPAEHVSLISMTGTTDAITVSSGHFVGTIDGLSINGGTITCASASPWINDNRVSVTAGHAISLRGSRAHVTNNFVRGGGNGGIDCSDALIQGNTIKGSWGNGITCSSSSKAIIRANTIVGNGGGIYCSSASPEISNNFIAGNNNYGVSCSSRSNPTIINNTIAGNALGAISLFYYTTGIIANNIVAFNPSGIRVSFGSSATCEYNCVYNPNGVNYDGIAPGVHDINLDPLLESARFGRLHIQPASPCVGAGNSSRVLPVWTDIDGQSRIQGAAIDIGADESDGAARIFAPAIVRVAPAGSDANDGSDWTKAKLTVQAGINSAAVTGGEVWVASGTYHEQLSLSHYVEMYGGFAGSESSRDQRNSSVNVTTLDGDKLRPVVVTVPGYRTGVIDGFRITRAAMDIGAIICGASSPVISNNVITSNDTNGVFCSRSYALIDRNVISSNLHDGVNCEYGGPTISGSQIFSNGGYGVYCNQNCIASILRNCIFGNTYAGILCGNGSAAAVASNLVVYNRTDGVYTYDSKAQITGNTIVGSAGVGISGNLNAPSISNNVVAFNNKGIGYTQPSGQTSPVLRNNCVYGNTSSNYSGVAAGSGDQSMDPQFMNWTGGDYSLKVTSPCVNAGWNDAPGIQPMDIDSRPRICFGTVDIGAFECMLKAQSLEDAKSTADGVDVDLDGAAVSAGFDGFFYIQKDNRSSGVRVVRGEHGLQDGMRAHVIGRLSTNADGERCIIADSALPAGQADVGPLAMPNRSLGGADFCLNSLTGRGQRGVFGVKGLNNIGLLITTWGKVTSSGTDWFYINDGSGVSDGSGVIGVYVSAPGLTIPPVGAKVAVTGVSSCRSYLGQTVSTLLPRHDSDIRPMQ